MMVKVISWFITKIWFSDDLLTCYKNIHSELGKPTFVIVVWLQMPEQKIRFSDDDWLLWGMRPYIMCYICVIVWSMGLVDAWSECACCCCCVTEIIATMMIVYCIAVWYIASYSEYHLLFFSIIVLMSLLHILLLLSLTTFWCVIHSTCYRVIIIDLYTLVYV